MYKIRHYIFALLAAFALLLAGCGGKEAVKPSQESLQSKKALETMSAMEKSYISRDMAGVMAPVAQDLKSGYSEFQTSVRKDIESYSKVELDMGVDRVEITGDLVKVVFHWFGRWSDKDGLGHEGRGNTVFVFKDTGSSMPLQEIVGDSPFGVAR